MGYLLNGTFVEACDCRLMCPCWTDDEPDDGHCTGLFAWSVDTGSTVDGLQVAGALTALGQAFSGDRSGPLEDLKAVNGTVVLVEPAGIAITATGDNVTVTVDSGGTQPVVATLSPAAFDGHAALTLRRTALSKELGIEDEETVTAHHSDTLTIRAAALPGGFIEVTGRSGMRGPFHYVHKE